MWKRGILPAVGIALLSMGLAACDLPSPHVLHEGEFDRRKPDFGKEPADIAKAVVCYNERNTSPREVRALAREECGKYGRTARFVSQSYLDCPLLTPVGAYFMCDPAPRSPFGWDWPGW